MLFSALQRLARDRGTDLALIGPQGRTTYRELLVASEARAATLAPGRGRRIAVVVSPSPDGIATLAALDHLAVSAFLASPGASADSVTSLVTELQLDGVVRDGRLELAPQGAVDRKGVNEVSSEVTLLTSGTTGKPKAVRHTWDSLARPVRVDAAFGGTRWLLAYPLHLYAGLQVFLQCFLNGGTLVLLPAGAGPEEIGEYMAAHGVQYVSATPSFWRRLMSFGSPDVLGRVALRQITLGGEPVTDETLEALRRLFPAARLVHIYATSELGRCFSVTDGRAGFPARLLDNPPEGVSLRILDGELQVRSGNRMVMYDPLSGLPADPAGWFATGDLVEAVGDRIVFRGRLTDMINVGGNKVYPLEVERVLRRIDGVAEARVYAIHSSLVGEMVAAEVVRRPDRSEDELRRELAARCAAELQPHQRPRQIHFVERLDLNEAGKISRRKV